MTDLDIFVPPAPLRRAVVPAEQIESIARPLQDEIARLTVQVDAAERQAVAAEQRAASEDPSGALQAALSAAASMRAAAETAAAQMIEAARAQAAARVDAARAEVAAREWAHELPAGGGEIDLAAFPWLEPIVVEGPSTPNTWRLRSLAEGEQRRRSSVPFEIVLPMVSIVMVLIVVLAWLG